MATGDGPITGPREEPDAPPDEALARRVRQGDTDALERLVRRYVRPVRAIAASYLAEPADIDDAVQETFLRVVRGIGTFDPGQSFAPWFYQIARNVARDVGATLTRRQRRRDEAACSNLPSPLPGPDLILERSQFRARVDAEIARLPDRQRIALRLSDVEGYPTDEVGEIMGISPGTVRSHLHHARKALRAALSERHDQVDNTAGE